MLTLDTINALCLCGESNSLDYKRDQYLFFNAKPDEKDELLKDIVAMANADRNEPAYILIGVEELPNKLGKVVGIPCNDVIDDAMLHQFVNQKANQPIPFRAYVVPSGIKGKDCIQVIEIDACRNLRPFFLMKSFGRLDADVVYMRDGTTTVRANPMQVRKMGEEAMQGKARPVVEIPEEVKIERDWSAVVVEGATVADLDDEALSVARKGFAETHSRQVSVDAVFGWSRETFLEKTKLSVNGMLTRAAILLLGKSESAAKLSPFVAQITWNLVGEERAYEHFGPPFLLATTEIFKRIRKVQIKIVPKDSMLPKTVDKYTEKVVLEPLHNCIAHQDYEMQQRIVVTEYVDRLEFENAGGFFEGCPSDYVSGQKRPRAYRNRLLAEAMADLNMIDSMGFGIHDIYEEQRARFLPMPDYEARADGVRVRVFGRVLDEAYSRLLIAHADIPIADIVNLDRIQKQMPVSHDALARLRSMRYIEGRGKQVRISSKIALLTEQKAEYIQLRTTEDANLKRMVVDYITQYQRATRSEIDKLLRSKMHQALTEKEKTTKITNLLTSMRKEKKIVAEGVKRGAYWVLFKAANEEV